MAGIDKLFSLAQSQGVTVPEFIKFLASPHGYMIAKALGAFETQANLPQGILSLAQNPTSGVVDYAKTQAQNSFYGENNPSKIENIISEFQGTNPDKPSYVGPQAEDSPVSSKNTTDLISMLNQYQSPESQSSDINNIASTNSPNYVGPTDQSSIDNNSYSENLTNFLAMMDQYKQPETSQNSEVVAQNNPAVDFAPTTEIPIDFGEAMDYSEIFGGGGGGKGFEREMDYGGYDLFDGGGGKYMAYAKGGQIYRGIR